MLRRGFVAVALVAAAGCGSSASPAAPVPVGNSVNMSGNVRSFQSKAPLAGVTISGTGINAGYTTGASGHYELSGSQGDWDVSFAAPGFLTKRWRAPMKNPTLYNIDAIALEPPFDLEFYREFARGRQEFGLQPIRRWTIAPRIFFRTVASDTGATVPGDSLDAMEQFARTLVPQITGGRFQVAGFDRGPNPPSDRRGWIIVESFENGIPNQPGAGGVSFIGVNPGLINLRLNPRPASPATGCYSAMGGAFYHEIVHAMGFYHAPGGWSVDNNCNEMLPHVLLHADVAYSRIPGNVDPDTDDLLGGAPSSSAVIPLMVR
jgi:hypothetical protein